MNEKDLIGKTIEEIDLDGFGIKITFTDGTILTYWSSDGGYSLWDIVGGEKNAPTIGGWISVKDRLPVETHSIFWFWYGKKEWSKAMWREQSDKVLVTVAFKDGTRTVTTGETHDGVWNTTISRTLEPVVTHWMPLPSTEGLDET